MKKPEHQMLRSLMILSAILLWHAAGLSAQDEPDCRTVNQPATPGITLTLPARDLPQGEDLPSFSWLDRAMRSKKVLLIGENHWMKEVQALAKAMIFHINGADHFPLLFLEVPFSANGFVNAFIDCRGDSCDQWLPPLRQFFGTTEEVGLLREIRQWNTDQPDKKIRVCCYDFEQDFGYTLRQVFLPYFKALGKDDFYDQLVKRAEGERILAYMDSLIREVPPGFTPAGKPFMDQAYLRIVFDNLRAYNQANEAANQANGEDAFAAFMKIRIDRMIRNVTDETVFGNALREQKSVFLGGATHMRIHPRPGNAFPAYEGWFLANEYGPTKGKVLSVKLLNLGFDIPDSYYTGEEYRQGTDQFVSLVESYKSCFPEPAKGRGLLIGQPTGVDEAAMMRFQHNGNKPLLLDRKKDLKRLLRRYPSLKADTRVGEFAPHDWVIILPSATLFEHQKTD